MLATLQTMVITGIEARPVTVEIDIQNGLPAFEVVGLASVGIKEARERVRSALRNSGYDFPNRKITVNLAPADLKKEGSHFDLAIALGILLASSQIETELLDDIYLAGELSLNGTLRRVPGVLPMALALATGTKPVRLITPAENGSEAALVDHVTVVPALTLRQVCQYLQGLEHIQPQGPLPVKPASSSDNTFDYADVRGQETAKRALLIAASGMHNILMIGPPGGGKTMLARRLPGILPEMTREEVLETTRIYSVSGLLSPHQPLINTRPFRSPHKNASSASIIGGGKIPRPGEISLAQNGVLFLDEFPEFSRDVLEALRQPLEDKVVTIARAQATFTYPADFCLVASMNPCLCGHLGSDRECKCTPLQVQRYLNRISGPLLDRMDLHVEVGQVHYDDLAERPQSQASSTLHMRQQVNKARQIQFERFTDRPGMLNSHMEASHIKKYCRLDNDAALMLKSAFQRLHLSARAYDRILKVARTIADLEHCSRIQSDHVAEALSYRSLDRKYWAH